MAGLLYGIERFLATPLRATWTGGPAAAPPAAPCTPARRAALRSPLRAPTPPARAELPHVVIVGGGFAGLYAAKELRLAPVRVTLIDRRNHHLFQPLLYQVATAALNPSDIAVPIRSILRHSASVTVLLHEVTAVDLEQHRILADERAIGYDYLVLATGASHSYFGHDEWSESAPGLKTIEDALDIRRRVLVAFEAAERDPGRASEWLTFVVIGAGPTGVELAGALAEIARHSLQRDFRRIDPSRARVLLVEAAPRVLTAYPGDLSAAATRELEGLGVEVRTGARVTRVDRLGVNVGEERIAARTVLWAAGVQASALGRSLGVPLDRAGRVIVAPDLTVPGHPEVFVTGDLAALAVDGRPVPGVAPAAMQAGRFAARAILRDVRGEAREPFRYVDKGSLATIGRAAGVAELGRVHLSGPLAWLAWLGIHIFFLIGFRNRVLVLLQWAWSYVTFRRGARLITGEVASLLRDTGADGRPVDGGEGGPRPGFR